MFDTSRSRTPLVGTLRELGAAVAAFDGQGVSSPDLVVLLTELERLKCRIEGAQVMATVALDQNQRTEQAAAGIGASRQGQGVALQVALARRESHYRGSRHLELARTLVGELPHTLAALRDGQISEWRATLVTKETACLSRADRARIDHLLIEQTGSDADPVLWQAGERDLVAEIRRAAYRLDPESIVARRRRAESQRSVWLRPAPDAMTYLTALLPVADGVATFAALNRAADTAVAGGDSRARHQIMADLLVTRTLGQPDGPRPQIPATINVVISDRSLFGAADDAAHLDGFGPIPADLARELAGAPTSAPVELRRLYARPDTGTLVAMDSARRLFPRALATFIRWRDRVCRTPWCDAPIRHIDHVIPFADGGSTSATNGQGLCEACNHAKQAPGWRQRTEEGPRHHVITTTPAGISYRSTAPPTASVAGTAVA